MAKILIVDDDAGFREGLAETLTDLGHEPVEVTSGQAALDLTRVTPHRVEPAHRVRPSRMIIPTTSKDQVGRRSAPAP